MNESKIEQVHREIEIEKTKFSKFKRNLLIGTIICIPLLFIYPYMPGRRGRPPLIETMDYTHAIIFIGILWAIVIPLSYFWNKENHRKKIKALKIKKRHLVE